MKYIYTAFVLMLSVHVGFSQQARGWGFELLTAYQHNYSANKEKDVAIAGSPGFIEFGVRLSRKVFEKNQHAVHAGVGATFRGMRGGAEMSYCTPGYLCAEVYVVNSISTRQLQFPIRWDYNPTFSKKFGLSTAVTPSFRIGGYGYFNEEPESRFAAESFDIVPALTGDFGHLRLSVGVRAFNVRRIEEIYPYKGTFLDDNPGYFDSTFEVDNPLKVYFQVGYLFGR